MAPCALSGWLPACDDHGRSLHLLPALFNKPIGVMQVPIEDADFAAVTEVKSPLLSKAAQRLLSEPRFRTLRDGLKQFRTTMTWVEDSALFDVLRREPELDDVAWWDWPEELRFRDPAAIKEARQEHQAAIDEFVAIQYLFDRYFRLLYNRMIAPAVALQKAAPMLF